MPFFYRGFILNKSIHCSVDLSTSANHFCDTLLHQLPAGKLAILHASGGPNHCQYSLHGGMDWSDETLPAHGLVESLLCKFKKKNNSRTSHILTVTWLDFYSGATLLIWTFESYRMTQHSRNRVTRLPRYERFYCILLWHSFANVNLTAVCQG